MLIVLMVVIGSTMYVAHMLRGAAFDIAANAGASIVALEAAGSNLSTIQASLYGSGDVGTRRQVLEDARLQLTDNLRKYYSLPTFPGEQAFWPALVAAQHEVDEIVQRVVAEAPASTEAATNELLARELIAATARLDDILARVSGFNAVHAGRLSDEIMEIRQRSFPTALLLNSIGMLAACAVFMAYRIDERRRRQERLARDELDAFSGRVAHDLVNPLAAIELSLKVAERKLPAPEREKIAPELRRAERGLQGARRLIDGLLDFARAGARAQPGASVDVGEVIGEVVESCAPMAGAAGAVLTVDAAPNVAVACSSGVLFSLLSNLLHNAIRVVGAREVRRVTLRVRSGPNDAHFEVEDTGPGVRPELEKVIFEPLVQGSAADSGTLGLGLATVKRLAESHAGRVGLSSRVGAGATFWFDLPLTERRAGMARAS
jgi:signal transduction histidine kinase